MKHSIHSSLKKVWSLLLYGIAGTAIAQSPVLLKDINTNLDGTPQQMATIGNTVYFSARNAENGYELWKTNGTTLGTVLVKDINPGPNGSNPAQLYNANGTLFFSASDGVNGTELWKSDGTAAGTVMVKDIRPGGSSLPFSFFAIGNVVYFRADDGFFGVELWKSDGTTVGTKLVKDINPLGANSFPKSFIELNGTLFFTANNGDHGHELWKSDGTPAGTMMVEDINLNGNTDPNDLIVFNNQLFFTASRVVDGVFDRELWKTTNGTEATTVQVKEINRFNVDMPNGLTVFNNALYFTALSEEHGLELFKSDGTEEGTSLVPTFDIVPGAGSSSPNSLVVANNTLFFTAKTDTGQELWKVTTADVASLVADIRPGAGNSDPRMLTAASGLLFFTAEDGIHGRELWKSDGTSQGTIMVHDLVDGAESAQINQVNGFSTVRGADLFFSSNGPNGFELRRSNSPLNGTVSLRDIGPTGSNPAAFTQMGNLHYFSADDGKSGRELWKTNGTLAGTVRVSDIMPGAEGSNPTNLVVVKKFDGTQTLFFVAKDPIKGRELFKLENTILNAGPNCISDILPGLAASGIGNLTNVGGTLYFTAAKSALNANDVRIFRVNGSRTDVESVGGEMTFANNLVAMGNVLFFTQNPPNGKSKLCKLVNGTTTIIKEFDPLLNGESSVPNQLTVVGTTLFFTAADNAKGRELWKLESTPLAALTRISDIVPNAGSAGISNMVVFNNTLYFTAMVEGKRGIYKTNSLQTGVLNIGGGLVNTNNLLVSGSKMFFTETPTGAAPKLCILENGLPLVLKTFEILPDGQSSIPRKLTAAGEKIFFSAADAQEGRELWQSDGTALGTMRISNINPGIGDANILEIRLSGTDLYLSANNQVHGQEPWRLANAAAAQGNESEERDEEVAENTVFAPVAAEIKVYPNPATDFVSVDISKNELGGTLHLLSASGQLVRNASIMEGETSIRLELQGLPEGIYLVRWEQENGVVVTKKVIVQ
jgi:ELWxxDGT repeat protein